MDVKTKKIFEAISADMSRFNTSVTDTLTRYKDAKETARSRSSAYKDEESEYRRSMEGELARAKAEITEAEKIVSEATKANITKLRECLVQHVTTPPGDLFLKSLDVYSRYNVKLSRLELESLITLAAGSYAGMRALQSVAQKSGFGISFPTVADYEADLHKLESMLTHLPLCYAPLNLVTEGLEVMPERPVRRHDGSAAYMIKGNSVGAILTATEFNSVFNHLEETAERWSSSIVPALSELKPIQDAETGEEISPVEQKAAAIVDAAKQVNVDDDQAVKISREIGQRRAEAAAESARILSHYGAGNHIE